jgi:glutathione S-transferase
MTLAAAERIKDGRTFLLGTKLTGADIMMVSTLDWADHCDCEYPSVLQAYREQIIANTSYSLALHANKVT